KTIQSEFSDLRQTLQHQSTANVPVDRARAAISSFNRLIQKRGEDQFQNVLEQIQRLNKLCPGQQQDWQGAHLFLGLPGSGKTTCIMQIVDNLVAAATAADTPNRPNALITLAQPGSPQAQGGKGKISMVKIHTITTGIANDCHGMSSDNCRRSDNVKELDAIS
ncbi:hypothetical protein N9P41_03265, partial [Pseudomonadales bacterium]|nr:hypothetical protein [Pseudomonadales bacterium]